MHYRKPCSEVSRMAPINLNEGWLTSCEHVPYEITHSVAAMIKSDRTGKQYILFTHNTGGAGTCQYELRFPALTVLGEP